MHPPGTSLFHWHACRVVVKRSILVRRSGVVLLTPPVERFLCRVSAATPDPRTGAELQNGLRRHANAAPSVCAQTVQTAQTAQKTRKVGATKSAGLEKHAKCGRFRRHVRQEQRGTFAKHNAAHDRGCQTPIGRGDGEPRAGSSTPPKASRRRLGSARNAAREIPTR